MPVERSIVPWTSAISGASGAPASSDQIATTSSTIRTCDDGGMELVLIRHALPVRRELLEGVADPELSEAGVLQAAHLADYLAAESIDAVYASPLRRAIETAAPIAARFGIEVAVLDGI